LQTRDDVREPILLEEASSATSLERARQPTKAMAEASPEVEAVAGRGRGGRRKNLEV
jgi:hypothetical protein